MRCSILALAACLALTPGALAADRPNSDYRARLPQDEVIYFLLPDRFDNADPSNDRGGLSGGRLQTGFDPTDKAFYHGGDLKGVMRRLDYIQALGATSIWVAPIFKNKLVQGPNGHESAGYHGYWITDFTQVDPHFGTNADFKALVDAAHARGMKVYMDIVVNHTADVIQYRGCPDGGCPYRRVADYPYTRAGGLDGKPINAGFAGDNFAKLTDPNYAYQVSVPKDEAHEKKPDWLNDPIYYHNRGNTTFTGESKLTGDFVGLDDLMTENPRVARGFVDIFDKWIDDFHVDGFRIDTEQYVDPGFWHIFVPAILARAKADGIPHFHVFGEVAIDAADPAPLAEHVRADGIPAVLDFAVKNAIVDTVAGAKPPTELAGVFDGDVLYPGGAATAQQLPTFLGNHDQGRFAWFVEQGFPKAGADEVMKRVELGYAMLFGLRGVPTVYAGDEQGFVGHGGDQAARQDQFASKVASYNDQPLLGTSATTAQANFDEHHPLFRFIATLAHLRTATPALTRGRQVLRHADDTPGLFAVSRFDPTTGQEYLLAYNTSTRPIAMNVEVAAQSIDFTTLAGAGCAARVSAPGSLKVSLPPLGYAICAAKGSS